MEERQNWRLIGKGEGIHWNQLDEDISVKNMILASTIRRKSEIISAMAYTPCRSRLTNRCNGGRNIIANSPGFLAAVELNR